MDLVRICTGDVGVGSTPPINPGRGMVDEKNNNVASVPADYVNCMLNFFDKK